MRWRWRRESAAVLGEVELEEDETGHASARGPGCSRETTTVKLFDLVAQRGDDGGRKNYGGAGAAASPMVQESKGERQGGE